MNIAMTETAGMISGAGAILTILALMFVIAARIEGVRLAFKFIGLVVLLFAAVAALTGFWMLVGFWISGAGV